MAESSRALQSGRGKTGNGWENRSKASLGATRDHKEKSKGKGKSGDGVGPAGRGRGQRSSGVSAEGPREKKQKNFSALFDKKLDPVRVHQPCGHPLVRCL